MSHLGFRPGAPRVKPPLTPDDIAILDELSRAGLSSYTYGILRRGRFTLVEILSMTWQDMMGVHGMGPGRCRGLQLALTELGYLWPRTEPAESVAGP
jgi:hypothetical protein